MSFRRACMAWEQERGEILNERPAKYAMRIRFLLTHVRFPPLFVEMTLF